MEFRGEGTVIGRRAHGESAVIVDILTEEQGRIAGLLPGGASPKRAAMTQPGGRVAFRHRARLADQLGTLAVEPARSRVGLLIDGDGLAGLNAVCGLLLVALAEHDPHPRLTRATEELLDAMLAGPGWADLYLEWELLLLDEMGLGLDLSCCAVTGAREDLAYVSPRSGRAVSRAGAGEWAPRLLPLPALLGGEGSLIDGLRLTGHFLETRLVPLVGRPLPVARGMLVGRLMRR